MKVVKVWCEWDVGAQDSIYADIKTAREYMNEALDVCGCFENDDGDDFTLDTLIEEGLVGFEEVEVIGA